MSTGPPASNPSTRLVATGTTGDGRDGRHPDGQDLVRWEAMRRSEDAMAHGSGDEGEAPRRTQDALGDAESHNGI